MEIVKQDGEMIDIKGEATLRRGEISVEGVVIAEYKTLCRATEVFSDLICHNWNKKKKPFVMPKE